MGRGNGDGETTGVTPMDGRSARGRSAKLRQLADDIERAHGGMKLDAVLRYDASVIERLTLACEAALVHAKALNMDTPEDQQVVEQLVVTLEMALSGALDD